MRKCARCGDEFEDGNLLDRHKRIHNPIPDWSVSLWEGGIRTTIVDDRWFILKFDALKFDLPEGIDPVLDIIALEV
jgi:hypothetical protein